MRALIECAVAAAAVFIPAHREGPEEGLQPPEVGAIAPPFHHVAWLQVEGAGADAQPEIEKLRGQVVVVTTYGYYCDSCIRVGVPAANAIRASNPQGVRVFSITGEWGEDTDEITLAKARDLGIEHSIAKGGYFGEWTPYLNLNVNPNLTYAFVIARTGGVQWKGDPSRSREEYFAAVSRALTAVPAEPLPSTMAPELGEATRAYVLGEFDRAESEARSALKKLGSKPGAELERARDDANGLVALVEKTRAKLVEEPERAAGEKDPERFQRALANVRRAFPKGPAADRVAQLEKLMAGETGSGPACRAWAKWLELEAARPANFPAEKDKATSKFAKQLEKHASQDEAPGAATAKAWLEAFKTAKDTK